MMEAFNEKEGFKKYLYSTWYVFMFAAYVCAVFFVRMCQDVYPPTSAVLPPPTVLQPQEELLPCTSLVGTAHWAPANH